MKNLHFRNRPYLLIILFFIIWRLLLFLFSYWGEFLLPFAPRFPYSDVFLIPSKLPYYLWSFANFDGVHYLTIATKGYSAQFTQVFFPLYPLIISLFKHIFPHVNIIIWGLLISNISFLLSLLLFYKLLLLDFSKKVSFWSTLFILFFPTSYYFGSLYTESIFLLMVLLSYYLARKKNWLASSLVAGIASATRFVGIFLLPALLWEWYQDKKEKRSILSILKQIIGSPYLYIAPLGLLLYMVYLGLNYGDYLYFWHVQPVFGGERSGSTIVFFPQVIWRYLKIFLSVDFKSETFFISFLEFISVIGAATILIRTYFNKIRISYLIYALPALILPTLTGTFSSMPRYILVILPIYIYLGSLKNSRLKIAILLIQVLLLSLLTILFTRGHWVS